MLLTKAMGGNLSNNGGCLIATRRNVLLAVAALQYGGNPNRKLSVSILKCHHEQYRAAVGRIVDRSHWAGHIPLLTKNHSSEL